MNDDAIFERLVRIDPAPAHVSLDPATSNYARDLKGKIMTTDPNSTSESEAGVDAAINPAPGRGSRGVRRWVAVGAVAAGVVALVVGVAVPGDSEPEPIVFSAAQSTLSARNETAAADAASGAAAPSDAKIGIAPMPSKVEYVVEGDLPALTGKAQSWKSTGKPSEKQMTALVEALGIDADLVERKKADGGGFVAGPNDGSAPSVSFSDPATDAFRGWYYSAAWATTSREVEAVDPSDSTTSDAATSDASTPDVMAPDVMAKPDNLPTKDEARERVESIMGAVGIDVRDEDIEIYADDWSVSVTAWQRLGDVRAPVSWTFGFGDEGALTWAGGNLLKFEKGPKFPRVGTTVGVDRLSDPRYSGWYGYGPVSAAVSEPAIASNEAGAATTDTKDAMDTRESKDAVAEEPETVQTIVITGVKESLTPIIDADNILWMVPSYEYTVKDGYTMSVLAIEDEFIEQAAPPVSDETVVKPAPIDGAGSSGSSDGSNVVEPSNGEPNKEEVLKLVGLTEDEATSTAEANGWIVRISSRDGEDFPLTMDYVQNRVNLVISEGKVTSVSVG